MADVRINGKVYDWGSVVFYIAGLRCGEDSGIKSISWGQKRSRTAVTGMGKSRRAAAKTRGKYEATPVKVECLSDAAHAIQDHIAQQAEDGNSYGDVDNFAMSLQLIESGLDTVSIDWQGCSIDEEEGSASESSTDPLMTPLTITPLTMSRNGKTLYSKAEG